MRLSRKTSFFVAATLALACEGATNPPRITAAYQLETVNGQQLPMVLNAGSADTTTVLSGSIALDEAGYAVTTQRTRYVDPTSPASEITSTARYTYRIIGDSVAFEYVTSCGPLALCIGPPSGKINGSSLVLSYGTSVVPVYVYRSFPPD